MWLLTSDCVLLSYNNSKNPEREVFKKVARAVLQYGKLFLHSKKNSTEKKYTPVSEEMVIQSLFGEVKKSISIYVCELNKDKLFMSSTDNCYLCNFDVLDDEIICNDKTYIIEWWSNGANLWKKLFSKLFSNDSGLTEILVGADVIVAGLFTGINVRHIFLVLTAIETRYNFWITFVYLGRFKPASTVNTNTIITFDPLATQNAQSKLLLTTCRTTEIVSQWVQNGSCVYSILCSLCTVCKILSTISCLHIV